jgi:hypothetical protein
MSFSSSSSAPYLGRTTAAILMLLAAACGPVAGRLGAATHWGPTPNVKQRRPGDGFLPHTHNERVEGSQRPRGGPRRGGRAP